MVAAADRSQRIGMERARKASAIEPPRRIVDRQRVETTEAVCSLVQPQRPTWTASFARRVYVGSRCTELIKLLLSLSSVSTKRPETTILVS